MKTVLTAARALLPEGEIEEPALTIEDGVISSIEPASAASPAQGKVLDFGGAILSPGLTDIHIHGAAGHDVMEATPGALEAVERFLAGRGVTSYLPTTVTASLDKTLFALERLGRAVKAGVQPGRATPYGLHLEGPFLSHAKCGVHPTAELLAPDTALFERMWEASQGTIRMMTIAPELEGAEAFIARVSARGVRVSLGHSNATAAETRPAIAAGATHATHTFNAMRAFDHREAGILSEVLTNERMSADVIADGIHLSAETLKLFFRAKGAERAVLISDGISATGMPDGRYQLGGFEVEVADGRCLHNGRLAGSVLTLDVAVRNAHELGGVAVAQVLRMASANAERAAGLRLPGLVAGAPANINVFKKDGARLATFLQGQQSGG